MHKFAFASLIVVLALVCGPAEAQPPGRYVFQPPDQPGLTIKVASELTYLGRVNTPVGDTAQATEYVFAETAHGKLQRVFIAHFEHFLPDNAHFFDYPRLTMAKLGGREYLHQTWALRDFDLFHVPAMQEFLRTHALQAEPNWLVDRYVRVVDPARKNEVIFFYLEAASANRSDIQYGGGTPGGPPKPPPAVERDIIQRARDAFQVSDS